MARSGRSAMRNLVFGGPDRFRQVRESLRREGGGWIPVSILARREILTRLAWKRLIEKHNPAHLMEISDKVEQKIRLSRAGIPIPETFMIVSDENGILSFNNWLKGWDRGFVIKPSKGHGGNGVLVIDSRRGTISFRYNGRSLENREMIQHIRSIISGSFSEGIPDRAIIEERMILAKRLRELQTDGLIDIRIVVFRGFPIMAMTRLPTKRSEGRANIHQGALAAGISISEGRIITATQDRRTVKRHPGSGKAIIGFRFNEWERMLESASASALAMEMGYVGVDLTVDEKKGVVVIEVNKRPGLEIQNANRAGLMKRIRFVNSAWKKDLKEAQDLGPGVRAELSRYWDRLKWGDLEPEDIEE